MSPQRGQRGVTAGREEGEGLLSGNTEGQGDLAGRQGQGSPGGRCHRSEMKRSNLG